MDRPDALPSTTYKLRIPTVPDAFYITIVDIPTDSGVRPYEIFINTKNLSEQATITILTRLISGMFRKGIDPLFVVSELRSVFDPEGGFFMNGKHVPSLSSAIALILEEHVKKTSSDENPIEETTTNKTSDETEKVPDILKDAQVCPKCGAKALIMEAGCNKCLECMWSKCG